jgi:hypothetical protein
MEEAKKVLEELRKWVIYLTKWCKKFLKKT